MANGWVYALMNSQWPAPTNSSICRSASPHMNSSFSLRRFGVSRRITRARSWVCMGGSMVTMCSFIGSWSRWPSMMAPTSSPSSGTGKAANGPITELQDENVSVSR